MANNTSASVRHEAPHVNQTTRTATIVNAIKRRAQSVLNDKTIDAQSRAIIRYALEINDASLSELVRRIDAGETNIDNLNLSETSEDERCQEKIEALVEMICRGDEPHSKSAALLVLMATLENSTHPKALANTAKHLAFTRCGELNVFGMIEAQAATVEGELLANVI